MKKLDFLNGFFLNVAFPKIFNTFPDIIKCKAFYSIWLIDYRYWYVKFQIMTCNLDFYIRPR